jgi:hypothetical protein
MIINRVLFRLLATPHPDGIPEAPAQCDSKSRYKFPLDQIAAPRGNLNRMSSLITHGADKECWGVEETARQIFEQTGDNTVTHRLTTPSNEQPFTTLSLKEFKRRYNIGSKPQQKIGRTELYEDDDGGFFAIKWHRRGETEKELTEELTAQRTFNRSQTKLGLRSQVPTPICIIRDADRIAITFKTHPDYYNYVSHIKPLSQFQRAMCNAAYDLGVLLRNGKGFQSLLNIFHDNEDQRQYTCFPKSLGVAVAKQLPEFAGAIDGIREVPLYENIGELGLRDIGDMDDLDSFQLTGKKILGKDVNEAAKLAHFISLYTLIISILIAKRAEQFEDANPEIWNQSAMLYGTAHAALFDGLNVSYQEEVDTEKFNKQLQFSFTKHREIYRGDLEPYDFQNGIDHFISEFKKRFGSYPSTTLWDNFYDGNIVLSLEFDLPRNLTKPSRELLDEIFGPEITWHRSPLQKSEVREGVDRKIVITTRRGDLGYSVESGFEHQEGVKVKGSVGTYSGPLPLPAMMHHNYKATLGAVQEMYDLLS